MNRDTLNFINGLKNQEFRKSLISHGLSEQSEAHRAINALRKAGMLNSTEPRMTLYTSEINPYLYSDNSFIMKSVNDSAFAASGEQKLLNDSASGPTVTKGRVYAQTLANGDSAPTKTVKIRKNSSNPWEIEYFHTTPDAITRELTSEVPYEARGELLRAHANVMNQAIANFTAVEWAQGTIGTAATIDTTADSNTKYVFTSGSSTRTNAIVNGTGTVKKVTVADMLSLKKALQKQQVTGFGKMYFLPTIEQHSDLLELEDFIDYQKTGRESKLIKGEVGNILGITILEPRHREDWGANILYSYTDLDSTSTDLTKVEDTADSATSMVSAGMAWVDNLVLRAQGSAIVFPWMNSPIYMGDVYAAEMRYGAIKKRADEKGVVMLIDNPFVS